MTTEHRKTKRRSAIGNRLLLLHDPAPIRLPRATGLEQEKGVVVQTHDETRALCQIQSHPLNTVVPSNQRIGVSLRSFQAPLPMIVPCSIPGTARGREPHERNHDNE